MLKLLPCDNEIIGSSHGISSLQMQGCLLYTHSGSGPSLDHEHSGSFISLGCPLLKNYKHKLKLFKTSKDFTKMIMHMS